MRTSAVGSVEAVCAAHGGDRARLLDILRALQRELGGLEATTLDAVAATLRIPRIDVEGVATFYSFLSRQRKGKMVIRLSNDVPDLMQGAERVAESLEEELGIRFGETTPDGEFTLEWTSCIGLSDQAPSALFNEIPVPGLGAWEARRIVRDLREHPNASDLRRLIVREYGDGENGHELVRSAVKNNIRKPGEVVFGRMERGAALSKALAMSPAEVIREIKTARLRGRGGAGFPAGMKWEYARASDGDERILVCNADEGEPGTFKDRVVLTERPDLLFEGMTIAGYAIGARQGILYLRAEYEYLREYLELVLEQRRASKLLGSNLCGSSNVEFDIRIQMGAGAYVCGEETALLSSAEGRRGDPRNRPPFPAEKGYLGLPTVVNNVETLCAAARILEMGSGWFASIGTRQSTGTKLLSISGDCTRRGVYEVPFGVSLREVFALCGADAPLAAQVGGPSGQMIGEAEFHRTICFDDLATGGALILFGPERDPLEIASRYLEFFVHESCGFCAPCRVGNVLLKERLDRVRAGRGEPTDLDYLEQLARTIKTTSRCGLGQTSPNPVLSTLRSFRPRYERLVSEPSGGSRSGFDLGARIAAAEAQAGRGPHAVAATRGTR